MDEVTAASSSDDSNNDGEALSFSQRRALRFQKKKKKPHRSKLLAPELSETTSLIERNDLLTTIDNNNIPQNENEEEKMQTDHLITKGNNKSEDSKENPSDINQPRAPSNKFEVISNPNELQIDPSDIMSEVELIKRKIDNINGCDSQKNNFKFSESYLETTASKFVQLLSEKNLQNQSGNDSFPIYNSSLIMDKSIIYTLQNEIMRVFTLIVGIVEGVTLLSLFVVTNNTNTQFLQNFASLLYIIQFLSYIIAVLLIPYSLIILNYINDNQYNHSRKIHKYQMSLFIVCSVGVFLCCMIEFPISDKIYYLYSEDNEYFSSEIHTQNMSSQVSVWKKLHITKFCFLSIIWILCIAFFRHKPNEKKEE